MSEETFLATATILNVHVGYCPFSYLSEALPLSLFIQKHCLFSSLSYRKHCTFSFLYVSETLQISLALNIFSTFLPGYYLKHSK